MLLSAWIVNGRLCCPLSLIASRSCGRLYHKFICSTCIHHTTQIQDLFYQRSMGELHTNTDLPDQISGGFRLLQSPSDASMEKKEIKIADLARDTTCIYRRSLYIISLIWHQFRLIFTDCTTGFNVVEYMSVVNLGLLFARTIYHHMTNSLQSTMVGVKGHSVPLTRLYSQAILYPSTKIRPT